MSYYVTCPNCNTKIEVLGYFNNESNNYVIFCNSCCKEFEATYVDGEIKVKKEENMEELKYKVGDEVLIKAKITETNDPAVRMYPYRVMYEYNNIALTWGENVTETSIVGKADEFVKVGDQKTYEQGLNDAWEMAKLIALMPHDGGLRGTDILDIYDGFCSHEIPKRYSAQQAISKYNAWKERNEIKMGDIVEYGCNGEESRKAIFLYEGCTCYWVLTSDDIAPQKLDMDAFTLRKVGESGLDIADAFAKIREMED